MLSVEGANGPLVTFSICYFEHIFRRLIGSQSVAVLSTTTLVLRLAKVTS